MTNFQPLPPFPDEPYGTPARPGDGHYASWGRRVGGHIIDYVLIAIAAIIISSATGHHTPFNVLHTHVVNGTSRLEPIGTKLVFFSVVAGVISVLYTFVFLASKWRATLGMRSLGIVLARESDLGVAPLGQVAARTALYPGLSSVIQAVLPVVGLLILLDLLWPLWDPRNQTLHDKLVKTLVLRRAGP